MKEDHRSYIRNCTGIAEVKGSNPVQAWIFSSFLLVTAKIAYITAMIFLHIILHSAVHIYDFLYIHNFIIWISVSCFDGFTVWLWIEDPVVYCHPTTTPDVHLKTNTNTTEAFASVAHRVSHIYTKVCLVWDPYSIWAETCVNRFTFPHVKIQNQPDRKSVV